LLKNIAFVASILSGKTIHGNVAKSLRRTTHNISMILLAVLKANIMCHLQTLVFGVQHKPGEIWWASSLGDTWRQQHPETQHICEQFGVGVLDMTAAFGKWWTGNEGTPFNLFRTQKLGNVNFVSVDLINKFSDHGSGSLAPHHNEKDPKCNAVANKKIHSTALGLLEQETSISSNLMRSRFIEEASKHHGEAKKPAATAKPAPATAMTAPPSPQPKSIATDLIAAQCVLPIPPVNQKLNHSARHLAS
jgi:hypothetical protein